MEQSLYRLCLGALCAMLLLSSIWYDPNGESECVGSIDAELIFIDPGHGGMDPGMVGKNCNEADINLAISLKLADILHESGYLVVLSRETKAGLSRSGEWNKAEDMELRRHMAAISGASAVISIHQNSYPDAACRGAQVFYSDNYPHNRVFAELMQQYLAAASPVENHRQALINNDYKMLRDASIPSLIIECGFLSNPEEEALLMDESYQLRIAAAIADGLKAYLSPQQ